VQILFVLSSFFLNPKLFYCVLTTMATLSRKSSFTTVVRLVFII